MHTQGHHPYVDRIQVQANNAPFPTLTHPHPQINLSPITADANTKKVKTIKLKSLNIFIKLNDKCKRCFFFNM